MAETKFKTFNEIGSTGLDVYGGEVNADFLRELRGKEAYKRYNEMRLNSPIIGGLLSAIEQAIRGAEWNYASQQGENDPRLELLNRARDEMSISWGDHISEVLTMLSFGFALFEIVYKRADTGEVLWHKFSARGQDTVDRWEMTDSGSLVGVTQRAAPRYREVYIPIEKLLLYRTRVERNNPEGRSILRQAYTSYYYATNIQQIEGIGLERDLAGLPVITLPEGANTDESDANSDASKAAKIVRNIRRDTQEGVVLPFGMTLTLLSAGGARQFDTNAVIARYESRMLMSTLTQFLLLGQQVVGTQALSEDQTDFFTASVNHVADIIAQTHNKFAVTRLLELNGHDAEGIGIEHTPVGDIEITDIADFLQKVGDKVTWTAQDEVWLRSFLRLPEMEVEEIEAERKKKQEEQAAMFEQQAAARQPFGGASQKEEQPGKKEEPKEKMGAETFGAEEELADWEKRAKRVWFSFLQGQKVRTEKAAKNTKKALGQ